MLRQREIWWIGQWRGQTEGAKIYGFSEYQSFQKPLYAGKVLGGTRDHRGEWNSVGAGPVPDVSQEYILPICSSSEIKGIRVVESSSGIPGNVILEGFNLHPYPRYTLRAETGCSGRMVTVMAVLKQFGGDDAGYSY